MKRLYDDYKFRYPAIGNRFLTIPYNIIEFWYKSCFLDDLQMEIAEIRYNDEIMADYNHVSSYKKLLYGGQIRCFIKNTPENKYKARTIYQNLNCGLNKTRFDAVLHHNDRKGVIMSACSVGIASSTDVKDSEDASMIAVTLWFLSIKL